MKPFAATVIAIGLMFLAALATDPLAKQSAATQPGATQPAPTQSAGQNDIKKWIADLSSDDGKARLTATKALFSLGRDALEPLKAAGAKQITPKSTGDADTRRMDGVYSLLDGLRQNAMEGYRTDAFLLRVEKGCAADDVVKMGERAGFTLRVRNGINDGYCAAFPKAGKDFAGILKAILTDEPRAISVGLMYFAAHPVP